MKKMLYSSWPNHIYSVDMDCHTRCNVCGAGNLIEIPAARKTVILARECVICGHIELTCEAESLSRASAGAGLRLLPAFDSACR
jgi:hypothetical protein